MLVEFYYQKYLGTADSDDTKRIISWPTVILLMQNIAQEAYSIYKKEGVHTLITAARNFFKWRFNGLDVIKSRYISKNEQSYVIRDIAGSKMYLDPCRGDINRELLLHGIREKASTEEYAELLSELNEDNNDTLILDIGANIGYFVLLAARFTEDADIHAFEPESSNVEQLKSNIELNKLEDRVQVYESAVGAESGTGFFSVSEQSNLHSMSNVTGYSRAVEEIPVDIVSIDEHLSDIQYDTLVVRMDIEGYEYQAFTGMVDVISGTEDIVIFAEIHSDLLDREESERIINLLVKNGFRLVYTSLDCGDTKSQGVELDELVGFDTNYHLITRNDGE